MSEEAKKPDDDSAEKVGDESKLVSQNLDTMQQLMNTMMQKMAALEERVDTPPAESEDKAEPPAFDPAGLEEMSREQFAKAMLGQFQTEIGSVKESLLTEVGKVRNSVQTLDASTQVREAAREHPDFWDWKSEMHSLNKKHPTMDAQELYKAARAANPEKATELDAKHKPAKEESPTEEGAKDGKPGLFGGLAPTTAETEGVNNMKFEDAAEKAWQDTMSGLSEVLGGN